MDYQLGAAEEKFADIIWEKEPVSSTELVKLAADSLGWKKSTTYTVLRRLCEKGLFQNDGGTVTSMMKKTEYESHRCGRIIDEEYRGSLPAFIAAFMNSRKLSDREAKEIQDMIEDYRKGEGK